MFKKEHTYWLECFTEEATHALARYASRSGFTHCILTASPVATCSYSTNKELPVPFAGTAAGQGVFSVHAASPDEGKL